MAAVTCTDLTKLVEGCVWTRAGPTWKQHEHTGNLPVNMMQVCKDSRHTTRFNYCDHFALFYPHLLALLFPSPQQWGKMIFQTFKIPSLHPFNMLQFFAIAFPLSGLGDLIFPIKKAKQSDRKQGGLAFGMTGMKEKGKGQKATGQTIFFSSRVQ